MSDYLWIDPEGRIIASTNPSYMNGFFDKNDIGQAVNTQEFLMSNLLLDPNGKLIFYIVSTIYSIDKPIGNIICVLDADVFHTFFPIKRASEISSFGFVDRNGRFVYHSSFPELEYDQRMILEHSPVWLALQGEIVRFDSVKSSVSKKNRMGVAYPIEKLGWALFVTNAVDEMLIPYRERLINSLFILFCFLSVSCFFAWNIVHRNYLSVQKIIGVTNQVSHGNLSARTNMTGSDEISYIGRSIDSMIGKMNQKIVEAEEYSNLKAQFLSTMSHELKTPLNIIMACFQLIDQLNVDKPEQYIQSVRQFSRMLKQNSYRLLRLINNFIDMNRIDMNRLELYLVNGNFIQITEDITQSVVEYAKMKNIQLIYDTDTEEKIMAFDPDKVERILLNFLSNALKYTEPGGTITVTVKDKGESIQLSVKDNGIGIERENLDRIFERFVQVDNSLSRRAEGSGIGLSLAKALVDLHQGEISIDSDLGKGTELTIELPAKIIENENHNMVVEKDTRVERIHIEFSDIYFLDHKKIQ